MTVEEIKNTVMFQTNNDIDDMEDFLPYLNDYINDGYDQLVYAYAGVHLSDDEEDDYFRLNEETDVPALPEWTHKGIADWATWCCYRNGNSQKQQRGMAFRYAFEELLARVRSEGGAKGPVRNFYNIPR